MATLTDLLKDWGTKKLSEHKSRKDLRETVYWFTGDNIGFVGANEEKTVPCTKEDFISALEKARIRVKDALGRYWKFECNADYSAMRRLLSSDVGLSFRFTLRR
jgi:hypothetical protein